MMVYVLASKYSWNHFISEKRKRVQSFKIHFLAPLYTSASDCKRDENIPGNNFEKVFSTLPSHS